MSTSYTLTETETFSYTNARYMATKVSADLKRMQRFYGEPSDSRITRFESEIIELLKNGYLGTVKYGFKRNGKFIEPTLEYCAYDLRGLNANDDDPGRIKPRADISGASFYSYLTYSDKWYALSKDERDLFEQSQPFQRGVANEPTVDGYLTDDKTYSSGGRALSRKTVRSY
ncbi:MAG: hypothetical protein ACRBCK_12185 [Alphaproteobacteria bacterium]